ncbi:hypothetical protein LR48_Vigan05g105600 [Vigna angularis]|uniref:Uncharacterized protein n=1 Tax=Phaseolus angularis TaxID=3914 RepID=A0A0L9ULN3_PHAAN|nr:hypothetical protein LR48_Vigan05g105600 [Vigna angularis]
MASKRALRHHLRFFSLMIFQLFLSFSSLILQLFFQTILIPAKIRKTKRNWDELEDELKCQEDGTRKGQKEHQKRRLLKVVDAWAPFSRALSAGCLTPTLEHPFRDVEHSSSSNVSSLGVLHGALSVT